ncbi:putative reverse transcriptase, RNA-dependent DNA polymerase [Medicago truncatula]|uniref:Putative reverse transcriptase, RNA-dependent DNA polymerase n=1 Tax=Medicago truncatula TaxID=3880 RepID=A0A396GHH6_MEDTR|nr:putative reverse transcriptase, RNA-dependent DNA polymerase [Medicago truncatula]
MCENFSNLMQSEFEMSMMGELRFFLGLQIKQREDGIFIFQEKYIRDLLTKYKMNEAKIMSTSMHPSSSLDKDEQERTIILILQHIVMLILPETKLKEKAQAEHVNFLIKLSSVGHVENKIQLLYLLLKLNMYQLQVVALRYYG